MAARPPRPPDSARSIKLQNSNPDDSNNKCQQNEKSDCSCTNISIMQLFHEMKQVFPTVPDHVVNQCVIENCHDRENCIKNLKDELAAHPNTAQSYPSQVLRGNQNIVNNSNSNNNTIKKPLVPTRPAPSPKPVISHQKPDIGNRIPGTTAIRNNNINASDMRSQTSNNCENKANLPPQRPTTLNFHDPPASFNSQQPLHQHQLRPVIRPIRTAPLPPPMIKHTPPFVQNCDQNINTAATPSSASSTSIQSPASFSDSGESEISVNISLSPSSDRSRVLCPVAGATRRISSISVQPEPPYTRDFTTPQQQSPRSFTSLNLTLRKPSAIPQSPIDITAGPGLTYSSSSFDAKRGYHKNFHITVTDEGGTISASRIRPRSCYNMTAQHIDAEFCPPEQSNPLRTGISMPNVAAAQNNLIRNTPASIKENMVAANDSQTEAHRNIIQRQQIRKNKLLTELKNNRKRLEEMQRDVILLKSPIPPNETARVDQEIELLRCDCVKLCQEIERAKGAGVVDDIYQNLYNGQNLAASRPPPSRPLPPLPPPPRLDPPLYQPNYPSQQQPQLHNNYRPINSGGGITSSSHNQNLLNDDYTNANIADAGPPWICSMCTFQNYPLLNKCETCDNVRIMPGTVQIIPSECSALLSLPNNRNRAALNNNNNINNNNISNNSSNTYEQLSNSRHSINPIITYPATNYVMPSNS